MIDLKKIEHLAMLARLELSDEQKKSLLDTLPSIIEYMDILNEVDTSQVEATYQSTGLTNVIRKDAVDLDYNLGQSLLKHTNHDLQNDQIKVKSVFN